MAQITPIGRFREAVWGYYDLNHRVLAWRTPEMLLSDGSFDPYKIMVSEMMLQQTQVSRVEPKFYAFLLKFPTVQALAEAPLGEVLIAWQGLGYNRRAKYLWQAARMIVEEFGGQFPRDQKELTKLPGVGKNTAGAIMAYAYDEPAVFVETNIRTVFIHHFFDDRTDVADKEIEALVAQTLPSNNVREWYWALMDYGTYLKQTVGNKSQASKSYVKQSPFHGSRRQVRGAAIRYLSRRTGTLEEIAAVETDARLTHVLDDLVREGMVHFNDGRYSLA